MRPFAYLSLVALIGCSGGAGNLEIPKPARPKVEAVDSVRVAKGEVVIAGPPGYCIDQKSSRLRLGPPFVLLASCSSITGSADAGTPGSPGLLTASVDKPLSAIPSLDDLRAFLKTEDGRASLARDGQASSIEILETAALKGALLLRIRDQSPGIAPELAATYWRGLLVVNDRLITVAALAFDSRPLSADTLKGKLVAFIGRIRAESPTVKRSTPVGTGPLSGLFQRRGG